MWIPPFSIAAGSNGQIFIALMPLIEQAFGQRAGSVMKALRSS